MIERTTVRLPSELLDRARRKAADEGRTLTSLIEDGLRLVTLKERPGTGHQQPPIPVSAATGGPLPGIDVVDTSKLQELEDIEYVQTLKRSR